MIRLKYFLAAIALIFIMASCKSSSDEVNVYSGRHYQADEELFKEFTRQTGIRVNLVKADSDQLIKRLELEGSKSPADLFITADGGRMVQAQKLKLLQPVNSDYIVQSLPAYLQQLDEGWTTLSQRARVVVYHKERVNPQDLDTYEGLTEPKWKGRLLVRSSQNQYNQTLLASIIAHIGKEAAEEWAKGIVANMAQPPKGNDRDQVKAIAAGIGDIAIVNTYYIGLLLNSENQEEQNVARQVGIFFPNQNSQGTHINVSAMGLCAHAPNSENAIKLMVFLLSPSSQEYLSKENYEYPALPNVAWPELLQSWGSFKPDTLPLNKIHTHLEDAMIIFNKAGWN